MRRQIKYTYEAFGKYKKAFDTVGPENHKEHYKHWNLASSKMIKSGLYSSNQEELAFRIICICSWGIVLAI